MIRQKVHSCIAVGLRVVRMIGQRWFTCWWIKPHLAQAKLAADSQVVGLNSFHVKRLEALLSVRDTAEHLRMKPCADVCHVCLPAATKRWKTVWEAMREQSFISEQTGNASESIRSS